MTMPTRRRRRATIDQRDPTRYRRVPDDIILSVASREFEMGDNASCVCGWIVREAVARLRNVAAEMVDLSDTIMLPNGEEFYLSKEGCHMIFGGSRLGWEEIFHGVTGISDFDPTYEGNPAVPDIERAFMNRVMEARNPRPSKIKLPKATA